MVRVALAFIRFYQRFISPFLPAACRFTPSCSHYAIDAYRKHGFWGGSHRAVGRVCRCHPWSPGGYDPVDEP